MPCDGGQSRVFVAVAVAVAVVVNINNLNINTILINLSRLMNRYF